MSGESEPSRGAESSGGAELAGPELAGSELAGSELAGPELAGSELAGSKLEGSLLAGPLGAPEQGVRFVLVRAQGGGGLRYRGAVRLPAADVPLEVAVDVAGDDPRTPGAISARAHLGADVSGADALVSAAARMVQAAVRAALVGGRPPPRRIARWRPHG